MKNLIFTLLVFFLSLNSNYALTFVSYQGFSNPTAGTLCIWVNADTNFGEGVMGQIRYGSGPTFSGFVVAAYDDSTFPGANWKVTVNYPTDVSSVDIEVAGCSDFGNCTGTGFLYSGFANTAFGLMLPVEFSSFTATQLETSIHLKWSTETESNNSHFEIERSTDSRQWEILSQVDGQGFSYDHQAYAFQDSKPLNGINYYRLQQVDFDGSFDYSETLAVRFETKQIIGIYPNPVRQQLFVQRSDDTPARLSIYNLNGQLQKEGFQKSDQPLDVKGLPSGWYYLIVRNEDGLMIGQEKFVKQ